MLSADVGSAIARQNWSGLASGPVDGEGSTPVCLLPSIVVAAVSVVFFRGTGALGIFFNTLAVLFLLKVDDQVFTSVLSKRRQVEVQRICSTALDQRQVQMFHGNKVLGISLVMVAGLLILLNAISSVNDSDLAFNLIIEIMCATALSETWCSKRRCYSCTCLRASILFAFTVLAITATYLESLITRGRFSLG